ncbi:hypothetical protein AQ914_04520 [Burkholderia pseudomallei]|uniref:InvB/SpaK family type III secretion system chaperone n=1 Tax=Burkholderia pseudomallei TaxID=28450 RepID=UPI0009781BFE|nr:hypothetical protein [Burkholderia pseudomallei]ONC26350.1 hypothetical protein AQ914_04520 [Burkholderia pseudomallei]
MNLDIVKLVRDCMEKIGCASAVAGELDPHSPICIGFQSLPDIYVEQEGEHVLLWSVLPYAGPEQLSRVAADIVAYFLPKDSEMFFCRRPLLSIVDEKLMLHATVQPDYLAGAEQFASALEFFFENMCAVNEMLSQ